MSGYQPDWPLPSKVRSYVSYRSGGASEGVYSSNNLGDHVGDAASAVRQNRERMQSELSLPSAPRWLQQVHGNRVVRSDTIPTQSIPEADGCYSNQAGVVCAVLTADCLPVLLCDVNGAEIAAVHCGWRSLAANILHEAIGQFSSSSLMAYLGPGISAAHYEVSAEVKDALASSLSTQRHTNFYQPSVRENHFYVDLNALASAQLQELGVTRIYSDQRCTYAEPDHFYSYRRDGETGRLATLIWRES